MTAEQAISWLTLKPKDLPVFVLIATDPLAPGTARYWAESAIQAGVDNKKVLGAFVCATALQEWPEKKLPG